MSDLYNVAQQLEALNSTFEDVKAASNAQLGLLRRIADNSRQGGAGGGAGGDAGGFGHVIKEMASGKIVSLLAVGLRAVQNSARALEDLQVQSLTTGVKSLDVLDTIAQESIKAKDADDASRIAFAGVKEATQATVNALKSGLDLTVKQDERAAQANSLLRNQIALLESQGGQGKVVIAQFQDLLRKGYTEQQARETTKMFADIATFSMQTAQNTKRFLDSFTEIEVLNNLFRGGGTGFQAALAGLVPDVDQNKELAKSLKDIIMPSDTDAQFLARQLGPERDQFISTLDELGNIMSTHSMDSDEYKNAQRSLLEETQTILAEYQDLRKVHFQGLDFIDIGIVTANNQFLDQMKQGLVEGQSAIASLNQQIRILESDAPRRDPDENLENILEELEETFMFANRRLRDTFFKEAGDIGRDFRAVGIAAMGFLTDVATSGIEQFLPQAQGALEDEEFRRMSAEKMNTFFDTVSEQLQTNELHLGDMQGMFEKVITGESTVKVEEQNPDDPGTIPENGGEDG